ncbi:hypothetical protein CDAR_604641 [Caerostris darwini]|uniref:Secreted protein n=1 Tax=Caerostris darwini TaxID=1538125 RepID=A0AAV4MRY4_9ARAC|nr:hypothetical protein CDAR_604641 [Caerostris darwini]
MRLSLAVVTATWVRSCAHDTCRLVCTSVAQQFVSLSHLRTDINSCCIVKCIKTNLTNNEGTEMTSLNFMFICFEIHPQWAHMSDEVIRQMCRKCRLCRLNFPISAPYRRCRMILEDKFLTIIASFRSILELREKITMGLKALT